MKTLQNLVGAAAAVLLATVALNHAIVIDAEFSAALSAKLMPAVYWLVGVWLGLNLLRLRLRIVPFDLVSQVDGHCGPCAPVWVNRNQVDYMLTGAATGFFRRCVRVGRFPLVWLTGPEFHGYLRDKRVLSTYGVTGRVPS